MPHPDIRRAVEILRAGGLVAFPTETVYGLGADARNAEAVKRIFRVKGRPERHPLIVHVSSAEAVGEWAREVPEMARRLAARFWPGPLTMILKRGARVPDEVTGGQDTVGLRVPSHPLALELLREFGGGIAAPSANRFGRVSPTQAAHVAAEFGPDLVVLDGGPCRIGIESAIVDCTRGDTATLLRPGLIERSLIEAAIGGALRDADDGAPRAPGTLESHYAPAAKVRLMDTQMLRTALSVLEGGRAPQGLAVYSRSVRRVAPGILLKVMPERAAAAAHELFSVLRDFDTKGVRLIWVETPPAEPAWEGVRDRLQRAAAA